ncbi:hypothetical protein GCM10009616_37600 [Microlunatus lacustris]
MSSDLTGEGALREAGFDTRDFDYGVGDDLRQAQQQVRVEIAARIRDAARRDPSETPGEKRIYELAARIAERWR